MTRMGRNERCPCGSGKKFKKCCLARAQIQSYTREDRATALAKLDGFIDSVVPVEEELAYEEFWDRFLDREDELPGYVRAMSTAVYEMWFAFDRRREGGSVVADELLARVPFTAGERAFLETMRRSSMRLYEVVDVVPGVSLRLRDLLEGGEITVHECSGSRSLGRHEWIAARVVPRGASGEPEIESGILGIPELHHRPVRENLARLRDEFRSESPEGHIDAFYKETAPFFHDVWAGAFLEPAIPELRNTDGEASVLTRINFDVIDPAALRESLDGAKELERRAECTWLWSGPNAKGTLVDLGTIRLSDNHLVLEANSIERGERGKALIESLAGDNVRHRITSHEDMQRLVREAVKKSYRDPTGDAPPDAEIPFEVRETMFQDFMSRHYRSWLDESIPALDDCTPREAAKDAALRPALIELIKTVEVQYQQSLRRGEPAYDPSWMWNELGLDDGETPPHPPLLAHERVAQLAKGSGDLSRAVADELRRAPGFNDRSTLLSDEGFDTNLDIQRYLREGDRSALAPYLRLMIDFELHRRKSFWVDESLTYLLAHTDLDVLGRELRAPFPSFALVFTDRVLLSMGERLLASGTSSPLSGQILRVATVFVTEQEVDAGRRFRLTFALDALGADLPALIQHEIPLTEERPVQAHLDDLAPPAVLEQAMPSASPLRGLLHVCINAILYATSAGVEMEARESPPRATPGRDGVAKAYSSEQVYFLPGAIEISRVRQMRELERIPAGRPILRRFLVRGHWRRAAPGWADQRMRWIQPYWKGPDIAAIIERTYKLKP